MTDDQQREADPDYVPSMGDLRARHAAGMLALGYREGPGIDAQFDAALAALAPVQPDLARVLPDPTAGCCCTWHNQDAGGGYTETVVEYDPACPEHSEHLYDPRTGTWVHRVQPDPLRAGVQALVEALDRHEREHGEAVEFEGDRGWVDVADRLRALLAETEVPRG